MNEMVHKRLGEFVLNAPADYRKTSLEEIEQKKEALGRIGSQLIECIFEQGVGHQTTAMEADQLLSLVETGDLSPIQKRVLERVVSQFAFDVKHIQEFFDTHTKDEIIERVTNILSQVEGIEKDMNIDTAKVDVRLLPGCVALLLQDDEYRRLFGDLGAKGFTLRDAKPTIDPDAPDFLIGRFVIVNESHTDIERIIRHEYMHVLTTNYVAPQEIGYVVHMEAEVADMLVAVDQQIEEVEKEIKRLTEEVAYLSSEDILGVKQEIKNLKKKKRELMFERGELRDQSSFYRYKDMYTVFLDIRDELVSYAVEGVWVFDEDAFISGSLSWEQLLESVTSDVDRQKFLTQWHVLKHLLSDLKKRNASVEKALPIFLTSQSLAEITTRLQKAYT